MHKADEQIIIGAIGLLECEHELFDFRVADLLDFLVGHLHVAGWALLCIHPYLH